MAQVQNEATSTPTEDGGGSTLVLDLGSKRRKQVKKLRKGGGPLMRRVENTIDQLREDKEISAGAEVVVVIVKQKPKSKSWFF